MVTIAIVIVTSLVSFYCFSNQHAFDKLILYPSLMQNHKGEMSRIITSGFIHGDMIHLLFNMLTLYFFGPILENLLGATEFLIFYLLAMAVCNVIAYQKYKSVNYYRACGASGAVSAVVFSLVLFQPWSTLLINFFIPVYFILYAVLYVAYSYYMDKRNADNVAHDVHIYGVFFGILYMVIVHPISLTIFMEQIKNPPW